jgi:hypothetical protein
MELSPEKMAETLHHVLRAMMQFPVIGGVGGWIDIPSQNKKINSFFNSLPIWYSIFVEIGRK